MIDKLRLNFPLFIMPDDADMMRRLPDFNNKTGETKISKLDGYNADLYYNSNDEFQITVKNLFYGDKVQSGLVVQFNPNKLMWGTNTRDCTKFDIVVSIDKMKKRLEELNLKVNFEKCNLSRLDVGGAFSMKNPVVDYINALSGIPARMRRNMQETYIKGESIYFRNKSFQILAYDKIKELKFAIKEAEKKDNFVKSKFLEAELKNLKDINLLRMETQNLNTKALKMNYQGLDNILKYINLFVIRDIMHLRALLIFATRIKKRISYNFFDLISDLKNESKRYPVQQALMAIGLKTIVNDYPIPVIESKLKSIFGKSENRFIHKTFIEVLPMMKTNTDFELLEEIQIKLEDKLNEYLGD